MGYWRKWIEQLELGRSPESVGRGRNRLFKLLRFYSIASLVAILIAAMIFVLFIRKVAIQDIIELSERNNLTLAQATLNGVQPELLRFLATVDGIRPGESVSVDLPQEFTSAIAEVLRNTTVVRIKLYNRLGTVVFSTQHDQIGEDQEGNGGFQSAIKGKVRSILIYRDTLNIFDRETEDDNLISTYIPIRGSFNEANPGVFEIYTDATPLVSRNERTEFVILLGVVLILGFLYAMLVLIVRRASTVIDVQQQTIRERTASLEMLSAHLLTLEERDKKRIAFDLHEGLAQTLCALKMVITASFGDLPKRGKTIGTIENILPILQKAIHEVQDIAQGLRPSSLDTLGLLPTIDWMFERFMRANPEIRIEHNVSLQEGNVPTSLKVVVFRIVEAVLGIIAGEANTDRIQIELRLVGGNIALDIADNARYSAKTPLRPSDESKLERRYAKIHEQTILSGGTFSVNRTAAGGITIHAAWPAVVITASTLVDTECSILPEASVAAPE